MSIGTELRRARQEAGLSLEQLSARTKVQLFKLEALEADAFDQLPFGIYLDGIVRAYAKEVGVDPDIAVDRVREETAAVSIAAIEEAEQDLNAFGPEQPAREYAAPTPEVGPSDPAGNAHRRAANSRSTMWQPRRYDPRALDARSRVRRHVVVAALALLAAIGAGAYLYEASTPFADPGKTSVSAVQTRSTDPPRDNPNTPSTVRNDSAPTTDERNRAAVEAAGRTPLPPNAPRDTMRGQPERSAASSSATSAILRNRDNPARETVDAAAAAPTAASGASANESTVSGSWTVVTHVESSSYERFNGLRLNYRLDLRQTGNRVTGTGRKVGENGRRLGPKAQTPITVKGTIDGDRVRLHFEEVGARRSSQGQFDLHLTQAGKIRGRFTSNAARSAGTVEANRLDG